MNAETEAASPTTNNEFNDVRLFHQRFGFLTASSPGHLTKRKLAERVECMLEELTEFTEASGLFLNTDGPKPRVGTSHNADQSLPAQADALVDMVYFALGTAVMLGLPWQKLWDDVQRANMQKVRGVKPDRQHAVDVVKPPGWEGPKTDQILAEAGYDRDDWAEAIDVDMMSGEPRQISGLIDERRCRDDHQ